MSNEAFDYTKYHAGLSKDARDAFDSAQQESIALMAVKLKENRSQVSQLVNIPEDKLDDKKIADLAKEYVTTGKLNGMNRTDLAKNIKGKTSSFNTFVSTNPELSSAFGLQQFSAESLDEILPTQEQLNLPARRISEAVEEKSTSWLSKIAFFLQGLFNWLVDTFNGDKGENLGFWAHVDRVAAKSIAQSAGAKLSQDLQKEENGALREALGPNGVNQVMDQVEQGVIKARQSGEEKKVPTVDITGRLAGITPAPSDIDPKNWSAEEAQTREAAIETFISTRVQDTVNDFFDVRKNGHEWDKIAKEIKDTRYEERTKNQSRGFWGGVYYYTGAEAVVDGAKNWLTTGEEVSKTIRAAIGGNAGVVRIGDAVAEGAMDVLKSKDQNQIHAILENPAAQAEKLGAEIANATFETDKWKKVEADIRASQTLEKEQQDRIIETLRSEIENKTTELVKHNAQGIEKAAQAEDFIVSAMDRMRDPTRAASSVAADTPAQEREQSQGAQTPAPAAAQPGPQPEENAAVTRPRRNQLEHKRNGPAVEDTSMIDALGKFEKFKEEYKTNPALAGRAGNAATLPNLNGGIQIT